MIYLALKNVKAQKKLNALARSLDKPAFVSEISVMVDRLIRSATPPEALSSAAKSALLAASRVALVAKRCTSSAP